MADQSSSPDMQLLQQAAAGMLGNRPQSSIDAEMDADLLTPPAQPLTNALQAVATTGGGAIPAEPTSYAMSGNAILDASTATQSGGAIPAQPPTGQDGGVLANATAAGGPIVRRPLASTEPYAPYPVGRRRSKTLIEEDIPVFDARGKLMESRFQEVEELKAQLFASFQERCRAAEQHEWTVTAEFQRRCNEAENFMKTWQTIGKEEMLDQTHKFRELLQAFQNTQRPGERCAPSKDGRGYCPAQRRC